MCDNNTGACLNREYKVKTNSDGSRSTSVEDTYTDKNGDHSSTATVTTKERR